MKVSTDACLFGAIIDIPLHNQKILDIGTGTGLLALMAAQRSQATVDAVELDSNAAEQARKNIQESPWEDRLTVFPQAIQDFTQTTDKLYDCILCNPPFFTDHTASPCPLRHQARHNDSLSFDELANCAKKLLDENGQFHILLPTSEQERFIEACKEKELFLKQNISVRPTLKKAVSRQVLTFGHKQEDVTKREICIHGEGGYTAEFIQYLKPFYLKL